MKRSAETEVRINCSTGTLYHLPLATALGIIRDAGFDGAELVASPETMLRGLQFAGRVAHQAQVPICTYHPPLSRIPGWPNEHIDRILAVMRDAYEVGAHIGVIHAPKTYTMTTTRGQAYTQGIILARRFQDYYGVQISLETTQRPWKPQIRPRLFDDMGYFLRFTQEYDLGVTFDTSHSGANGDDISVILHNIGNRLCNIHVSDCRIDTQNDKPFTHLFPGNGNTVDFDALTTTLIRTSYQGVVTLEISPFEAGFLPINTLVRRLSEARTFLTHMLQKKQLDEIHANS